MNLPNMTRLSLVVAIGVAGMCSFSRQATGQDTKAVLAAVDAGIETESDFKSVFEFVRSSDTEEKWRSIGWIPSLWSGVQLGDEKHKPIFVWAMNGDPLGCV